VVMDNQAGSMLCQPCNLPGILHCQSICVPSFGRSKCKKIGIILHKGISIILPTPDHLLYTASESLNY
jgi:hypothetical protein